MAEDLGYLVKPKESKPILLWAKIRVVAYAGGGKEKQNSVAHRLSMLGYAL
jgi:hypothetical protein